MISRPIVITLAAALLVSAAPAWADSGAMQQGAMQQQPGHMDMKMPMAEAPAHFAPTREAYTTNREFLVKLVSLPSTIPFEQYFELRFAVFDGKYPSDKVADAKFSLYAGMRHGLKHGFAHGMQSSPKVEPGNGEITVSGMYFHMMGPWVLKVTVSKGNRTGVAYFKLPCCGQ